VIQKAQPKEGGPGCGMILAALVVLILVVVAAIALLTFFANREAFDDVSDGDAQEEVVGRVGLPDQFAIAFMQAAGGDSGEDGDEEAAEETAEEST
jgi:hypothetical protein